MIKSRQTNRRQFVGIVGGALVLPAAASLLRPISATAAEAGILDEADPAAAALGYRKDTTQVDRGRYPQHQVTQVCSKCRYFKPKGDSAWAPCAIFAGKGNVHANGWCAAYAAR